MGQDVWVIIVTGFTLGFAYSAVPGAVNAESIWRGFAGGFRPALLVQVGSLLGDLLWAVLGLTGAAVLWASNGWSTVLGVVGAGFLFLLARDAFRSALDRRRTAPASDPRPRRHLLVGAMFSLANPVGLAFWAGMGSGSMATLDDPSAAPLSVVLGGFVVGTVVWSVTVSAIVALGRRHATPRLFRLVDAASGVVFGWFGVRLLWSTLRRSAVWLGPLGRALG